MCSSLAAHHSAHPLLSRAPALASASGRAALLSLCAWLGLSAGPLVFAILSTPLLVVAGVHAYAAHTSAAPLRVLRAQLADAHGAQQAFSAADSDRSGTLSGGALSQLSAAFKPGEPVLLRGVTIALCPFGGHAVTADSLGAWVRLGRRTLGRPQSAAAGSAYEAVAVGGEEAAEEEEEEVPPLSLTYYGESATYYGEASTTFSTTSLSGVLSAGPPGGGWVGQRAAAACLLAAACVAVASALAALSTLGSVLLQSASSLRLFTLLLPAGSLAIAAACASIDAAQLRAPIGPAARPFALRWLAACPLISLAAVRAVLLLLGSAGLWRALPSGSGLAGALASLSGLLALGGACASAAAASFSWRVAYALLVLVDPAALLSRPQSAEHISGREAALRDALASSMAATQCDYLEGSVVLDLDRDGTVNEADVARFYGVSDDEDWVLVAGS